MKLKRAKAYRKQMHQYELHFAFREPYQVLLDSSILQTAARMKIDLISRLEGILQGKVKPMITQCDMRHLYNATPKDEELIAQSKGYERRRCNHHELEEPLSTFDCLRQVVGPSNKHRYVVASDEKAVRVHMRAIPGVPLIYISKSIVLLEPMTTATEELRDREEKSKFKAGLKGKRNPASALGGKRKRDEEGGQAEQSIGNQSSRDAQPQKKKKQHGAKAPNPLSIKKPKKVNADASLAKPPVADTTQASAPDGDESGKRKRRRKHKSKNDGGDGDAGDAGDEGDVGVS